MGRPSIGQPTNRESGSCLSLVVKELRRSQVSPRVRGKTKVFDDHENVSRSVCLWCMTITWASLQVKADLHAAEVNQHFCILVIEAPGEEAGLKVVVMGR